MALSPEKLAALRAKAAASKLANIDPLPAKVITTTAEVIKDECKAAVIESGAKLAEPVSSVSDVTVHNLHVVSDSSANNVATSVLNPSDLACSAPNTVDLTPQQYVVVEKIEMIKKLLLQQNPMMETLLKQVHTALKKDPELVHFLQPDQIGAVVKGCMEVAKVVIVATAIKKTATASGKKLSQLTLSDL